MENFLCRFIADNNAANQGQAMAGEIEMVSN